MADPCCYNAVGPEHRCMSAEPRTKPARKTAVSSPAEDKPYVGPEDLLGFDPATQTPPPGEYPYTRGIHRTMYRHRLWTMRQFAGFGSAEQTNERFKFLLEK